MRLRAGTVFSGPVQGFLFQTGARMSFSIVHELQGLDGAAAGRMRVRAGRPLSPIPAAGLARNLEELPGISEVRATPRVGSLLFFYADQESRA